MATDEEIESDPEAYDCEGCEHRMLRECLSSDDEHALRLHHQLSMRAVQDLHLTPMVFDIARLRLSEDEAAQLLDRLDLIHEHLSPAPTDPESGKADTHEAE
jgi:hypothetical protein